MGIPLTLIKDEAAIAAERARVAAHQAAKNDIDVVDKRIIAALQGLNTRLIKLRQDFDAYVQTHP